MRCRDRPTLIQSYGMTTLTSEGFFHDLWAYAQEPATPVIPFLALEAYATRLDTYYFWSHSGDKRISKIVRIGLDDDGVLTAAARSKIAETFWQVYSNQLLRQWGNYIAEYEPERPYDIHEETEYEHGNQTTVEDDGTVTDTKSGTVTNISGEQTGGDWLYGFDSDGQPTTTGGEGNSRFQTDDAYNRTRYGYNENGKGVTQDDPLENRRELDTLRTTRDKSNDELLTHKYGSLGTVAMGEIMTKEFEAWMWNFFINVLFPAVDHMLTIPIY